MPMTPQDIQAQQFHVRFRGFDVEEVDNFLEKVAEEYLALMEENQELHAEIDKIRQEVESYRAREKTFQNAIMSAQQIAEEMKVKSRKQAQDIIAAAREEARQIQKGATAEVAALEQELDRLNKMKGEASRELRQVLQRYLAQLEEGQAGIPSFAPAAEPRPVPTTAPPVEPAQTPRPAGGDEESLMDLSELYERIDLVGEEIRPEEEPSQQAATEEQVLDLLQTEGAEPGAAESTVPDLEGDMLFALEDPLDEGPEISFEEEADQEEKSRKKGKK